MLGRRGRASMPGSWGLAAIGKKSCRSSPHTTTSIFWGGLDFIFPWYAGQAGLCRAGSPKLFSWEESRPWRGLRCRAGAAGGALVEPLGEPLIGRATHWASPYLGEPVLGRAIKRGWGEPSNEVGGEPSNEVGRAIKRGWASPY